MVAVTDSWKENQLELITSEGFVEILFDGKTEPFNKNDIVSYTHEQTACLLSGELPSNKISFSLDNSSGAYNPTNISFAENQKIMVRYGFKINDSVEMIKAGTFYLEEWHTPANGLEANFSAKDLVAFMIDKDYTGREQGTLYEIAQDAISLAELPSGAVVYIDDSLKNYTGNLTEKRKIAEVLQLCAHAAQCVMHTNRDGELRIEPMNNLMSDYVIRQGWAYSYPEYETAKQLKSVKVTYANDTTQELVVSNSGETQSVANELISDIYTAYKVAHWVKSVLINRQTVSGEFRADPRLDVLDKVAIESKYGVNRAVLITYIKYVFTGSFKGTYKGRVSAFDPITDAYYSGELFSGEV